MLSSSIQLPRPNYAKVTPPIPLDSKNPLCVGVTELGEQINKSLFPGGHVVSDSRAGIARSQRRYYYLLFSYEIFSYLIFLLLPYLVLLLYCN